MGDPLWGKVVYRGSRQCWGVRGTWEGKRIWFSAYRSSIGQQVCRTKAEAIRLQGYISNEIAQGIFDPARYRKEKPLHVAKYADEWLESVKPNIKYSTWKAYRAAIKSIKEGLGDVFLPNLQYDRILAWVNSIPLDVKTKKNYHGVLAKMLSDAKRSRKISSVPDLVQFRGGLSIPYRDPDWIDSEQQELILSHIPAADRWIFRFMMLTGVRPSEARAVMRQDVFADRGYIKIVRTFAPGDRGEILQTVKQNRERRVRIDQPLADLLKTMPVQLKSEFLFVYSVTGRPYTKNINRDLWNPACRAAGIKIDLYNATRHSFANQHLAAGEDLYEVSLRLGHASVKVTQSNYANANARYQKWNQGGNGGPVTTKSASNFNGIKK